VIRIDAHHHVLFSETGAAVKDEWTALLAGRFPQLDVPT
jgi:hypothetical protein